MSASEEGLGPAAHYGIELRLWERQRLKNGQEKLGTILNRILRQGLQVYFQHRDEGKEPGERELGILKRTAQVLRAAEHGTIRLECSSLLLRAHGFIDPTTNELPEIDDLLPTFTFDLPDIEEWMGG